MEVFPNRCSVNLLLVLIRWLCWWFLAPRVYFSSSGFLRHKDSSTIFLLPESYHFCWKFICWLEISVGQVPPRGFLFCFVHSDVPCQSRALIEEHWVSLWVDMEKRVCIQHNPRNCKTNVLLEWSLTALYLYCNVTATSPILCLSLFANPDVSATMYVPYPGIMPNKDWVLCIYLARILLNLKASENK